MRDFMDKDFLLYNDTAKELYHGYAADMPIIDYHCHINPAEIMENRKFDNITRAWLGGDHYKWRLIRSVGVDEHFITGDAPDREKFQKFAETLPLCVGNPIHHWTHLELRRYFGCDTVISGETAQEVWDLTGRKLAEDSFRVRGIIERSNVQAIGTTDDPIDDLRHHKALRDDTTNSVIVSPTFRPDKAINIDKPGFAEYLAKLGEAAQTGIATVADLKAALLSRIEFFNDMGCRASDHGLDYVPFRTTDDPAVLESIFARGLRGEDVSEAEAEVFKTDLMLFFGREFARLGWVMQLHYGAMRNNNAAKLVKLGPDTGFDAISTRECSRTVSAFLNALELDGKLPRTILYSLNPNDDAMLVSLIGAFQGGGAFGKVQHGSAWWFNDTKTGMEKQILTLANGGVLGAFIGMLTDSRSFLSYTRHEYFRRILCNILGTLAENGEYPRDIRTLGEIARNISYRNAARYFGYDVKM
ncbi:MAG: glucuronate isomerase [Defluviitaleaceae bacterium]|nr:glucuronate isomerase [Defluviitaleaceae bacterium]